MNGVKYDCSSSALRSRSRFAQTHLMEVSFNTIQVLHGISYESYMSTYSSNNQVFAEALKGVIGLNDLTHVRVLDVQPYENDPQTSTEIQWRLRNDDGDNDNEYVEITYETNVIFEKSVDFHAEGDRIYFEARSKIENSISNGEFTKAIDVAAKARNNKMLLHTSSSTPPITTVPEIVPYEVNGSTTSNFLSRNVLIICILTLLIVSIVVFTRYRYFATRKKTNIEINQNILCNHNPDVADIVKYGYMQHFKDDDLNTRLI